MTDMASCVCLGLANVVVTGPHSLKAVAIVMITGTVFVLLLVFHLLTFFFKFHRALDVPDRVDIECTPWVPTQGTVNCQVMPMKGGDPVYTNATNLMASVALYTPPPPGPDDQKPAAPFAPVTGPIGTLNGFSPAVSNTFNLSFTAGAFSNIVVVTVTAKVSKFSKTDQIAITGNHSFPLSFFL
jgi:hypothetical protein